MPILPLHVGPFEAIFVGLGSGLDSAQLSQLTSLTTGPQIVELDLPETFNYSANNSLQSGAVILRATLTFLSDDSDIVKLASGNFIDAAESDSPSQQVKLMVLLLHPKINEDSSILIPTCYVQKTLKTNYQKNAATEIPLTFYWQQINRFRPQMYYRRTPDDLKVILGARSPY